MTREPVAAYWCRVPSRPNFGDALTPWLIRKLSGRAVRHVMPQDPERKLFVTGSIIAQARSACIVWGAGIMNVRDEVSPDATLLAVRGPLTRARALECGAHCPAVYGDPALLLPRLYRPRPRARVALGVAPHYSDRPRLMAPGTTQRRADPAYWIDLQDPIEQVIDAIVSCELVVSSSLHGLIVSHAYGVPCTWIEFRPLPSGDGSKFRDYLLSIGCERSEPLRVRDDEAWDLGELWRHAIPAPHHRLCDALLRAFPY